MFVLAVDTTSAHGSLALLDGGTLAGVLGFRTARPRHAEGLLPAMDFLLGENDAKLDDVDGFAVAVGPGSFTGLRIGIATVEGLAFATARPVVGVSTLEATAYRYRYRKGLLVSLIDAHRGDVYGATYRSDGETLIEASEPSCRDPEGFLEALSETPELVAGSATLTHRAVVETHLPTSVTIAEPSFFVAEEIARLGSKKLERGERAPLGGLDALYIATPAAERNRRAREGNHA